MSESIFCPSCGREVPLGRFCKYCGKPLQKTVKATDDHGDDARDLDVDTTTPLLDDADSLSQRMPEPMEPLPDFEVAVEGMDHRSLALLLAKSELAVIDSELNHMIKLIEATKQALKLKEADKALLTRRADELKASFDSLKARRTALRAVEGDLPLEHIVSELALYKTKLEKLGELADQLDPVVYDEQHTRLEGRIKQLEKDHKTTLKLTRQWIKAIEIKKKDLKRDLSRLDAKYKIGDIPESSYVLSKAKVQRTIKVLEGGHESLVEMLKKAEKK